MIHPGDEPTLARIINDVLDERERKRYPYVDFSEVIRQVRSTADPNWQVVRQREEYIVRLEALTEILSRILPEVRGTDVESIDQHAPELFRYASDLRSMSRRAREAGFADIAEQCDEAYTHIRTTIVGDDTPEPTTT
jgi:hypothetical protein